MVSGHGFASHHLSDSYYSAIAEVCKKSRVKVRVFFDPLLRGTHATVRLTDQPPDWTQAQKISQSDASEASCWVWPEEQRLGVQCFNNGRPIQVCGHGLLASAYAWRLAVPATDLSLTLHSGGKNYTVSCDDDGLWLHCPRIYCHPVSLFPTHWFDQVPEAAALAGGGDGYYILRWPIGFDLARIRPRLAIIAQESRRGIIATAATSKIDCVTLRYFAPAYGNPEDSATGSAAVVLADYWQRPTLRLQQRSARGGRMKVRLSSSTVALSGAVQATSS